jgi:hypothetical protein
MESPTSSTEKEKIFEDHCVVFVDFLGFSNIVASGDEKMADLLTILKALQSSRSDFRIAHQLIDERHGSVEIKAAISAFSDHVVISYPLERMRVAEGLDDQTIPYIVMDHARAMISEIASLAFTQNLLVRGGITIGKLYHQEGVVFGQGLIDAYRLESEVAVYPRVVLSASMSSSAAWRTEDRRMVKRDFDGVYYLDYLHQMIMSLAPEGINWMAGLAKRMDIVNDLIQENIRSLENNGRLKEAAKWGWFYNKLADSIKTLPQDGLSDHGLSRAQLARLGLKD